MPNDSEYTYLEISFCDCLSKRVLIQAKKGNCFTMTQGTATDCSISMPDGILTDVVFNEGDVMMLYVAMKAVTGDHAPLTFDLA